MSHFLALATIVIVILAVVTTAQTLMALNVHNISNATDLSSGGKLIIGFEQRPYPVGKQCERCH